MERLEAAQTEIAHGIGIVVFEAIAQVLHERLARGKVRRIEKEVAVGVERQAARDPQRGNCGEHRQRATWLKRAAHGAASLAAKARPRAWANPQSAHWVLVERQ